MGILEATEEKNKVPIRIHNPVVRYGYAALISLHLTTAQQLPKQLRVLGKILTRRQGYDPH
jgi:hypothetical protein